MTIDSQPRDAIGQYGPKRHSDPEVPLAEEVDGSFLFPPSEWPGGAAEYVRFWKSQPISDEALTNFASAYAAAWDTWAEPQIDAYLHNWGNSEESRVLRNTPGVTKDQLWDARDAAQRAFTEHLTSQRPRRIASGVVRHVARAAQIVHNADRLPTDDDRTTALITPMYANREGDVWTAAELWESFRLADIMPDAFYSRENALQKELRDLRDSIVRGP
jgi:hypothetical protein